MLFFRAKPRRLLVIGLDCASPELVFDQFRHDMPTVSSLMDGGQWGVLESTIPCITVPAWASMTSSRDPGALGIYGFRNRTNYDYQDLSIADGRSIKVPRIWDYVGKAGRESLVVGVPQTYPIRPIQGHLVSGFLTPGISSQFTYPAVFKSEVLKHFPNYPFDVEGFRTDDKTWLRGAISDVTEMQFELMHHALTTKAWDFAMFVNMGTDRIHHGFWRYHDQEHRLYEAGNQFESVIRDYYRQIDTHIRDLLDAVPDDTVIMVVSDHGVKRMDGGFCLNEWLIREGWLVLKESPEAGRLSRFEDLQVDWSQTRAWGAGGYYGRIFLNVEGREPAGIIPPSTYAAVRDELRDMLEHTQLPDGRSLNNVVHLPEDTYTEINNIPPDLMVYFGDLHWRSVGSVGHGSIITQENDIGPDDANHAPDGIYILYDPKSATSGKGERRQLMDVAPTALDLLKISIPDIMQGHSFGKV